MASEKTTNLIRIAIFVAVICTGAFFRVPLPTVPFTLQFMMVNLAGLLLRKNHGTVAVAIYIFLGLLGLPVFASGGGFSYVLRPGFAYLLGFLACTFVNKRVYDYLLPRHKRAPLIAGFAGMLAMYAVALPYLYILFNFWLGASTSIPALIVSFFLIFLPGDIFSVFVCDLFMRKIGARVAAPSFIKN